MTSPTINYIVLGLAIIFEGAALLYALREFNKSRGETPTLQAVKEGKDPSLFVVLFEDSAAMLGLFIALIGITLAQLTGIAMFDGIASVLIGCVLGITAIWLAYETKGLLIGESADPQIVASIKTILESHSSIITAHEILTLHMGPEFILVTISADFKNDVTANVMEDDIEQLVHKIKDTHPMVKRVFIEAEKSKPES